MKLQQLEPIMKMDIKHCKLNIVANKNKSEKNDV